MKLDEFVAIFYRGKTRQEKQVEAIMDDVRAAAEKEKENLYNPLFGVSEPIISFVETVRNNPKRFRIREEIYTYNRGACFHVFKDKYTKEALEFSIEDHWYRTCGSDFSVSRQHKYILTFPSNRLSWISHIEKQYLVKEIKNILTEEYERKRERVQSRQRKHYMKIYCKGE